MRKTICNFCIMEKGSTRRFRNDEALYRHIEEEHDMPVRRDGESEAQAMERFSAKNKRAGTYECRCPTCHLERKDNIAG